MRYLGIGFLGFGGLSSPGTVDHPNSIYTPQLFADTMFGTPPFFSSCEFNWVDLVNGNGSSFAPTNGQVVYCEALMDYIAQKYANVKLAFCFGYNLNSSAAQTALFALIDSLMARPSRSVIGAIGFETEHTNTQTPGLNVSPQTFPATSVDAAYLALQTKVLTYGLDNIQYYPGGYKGTSAVGNALYWYDPQDSDAYPDSSYLNTNANRRGALQGGVGYQPWPDHGCGNGNPPPVRFYGPQWSLNGYPLGYVDPNCAQIQGCGPCSGEDWSKTYGGFPGTIARALYYNGVVNAELNRKYNFFSLKLAGTGFGGYAQGIRPTLFTGVSGLQTDHIWDNTLFRQRITDWVKANPGIYIQSGGVSPPPPPPPIPTQGSLLVIINSLRNKLRGRFGFPPIQYLEG